MLVRLCKPEQMIYCHPNQTLNLYHFTTKSVDPFHPYGEFLSLPLDSDRCSLQKQQEKREREKYERRDVADSVWRVSDRSFSSSIFIFSMWTIIFTALLPSFILSYEVDTKKLNGLAKARVEVSKAFHSASVSGRMMNAFRIKTFGL